MKEIKLCEECGSNKSVRNYMKTGHFYCGKHRYQLSKYGKIMDEEFKNKKEANKNKQNYNFLCCVCGKPSSHELIDGNRYCGRHAKQIRDYGGLKEKTKHDPNKYIEYDDFVKVIFDEDDEDYFLIDKDDFYKYCHNEKWWKDKDGYAGKRIDNKIIRLHRLIMGVADFTRKNKNDIEGVHYDKNSVVDHINRNKFDNRKSNLRVTTQGVNTKNHSRTITSSTGHRNIYPQPNGKVHVKINDFCKTFDTIDEAIECATQKRIEYGYSDISV